VRPTTANGSWSNSPNRLTRSCKLSLMCPSHANGCASSARYWHLNRQQRAIYVEATPLLWAGQRTFSGLLHFSDWLYSQARQTTSIVLATTLRDLSRLSHRELPWRRRVHSTRCTRHNGHAHSAFTAPHAPPRQGATWSEVPNIPPDGLGPRLLPTLPA